MRAYTPGYRTARPAKAMAGLAFVLFALLPAVAAAESGGAGVPPPLPPGPSGGALPVPVVQPPPVPGAVARLAKDGRTAIPPVAAPQAVKQAIYAANKITRRPYRYGGGHRSFEDSAYDCSGSVSYALHGAGILRSPLHSSAFMRWGEAGRGAWITVYTNPAHAYVVIAGLRFDTSGPGESGPRWRRSARTSGAFRARHPVGF